MSAELQNRAKAWLALPQRRRVEYAGDSMADWFIGAYATKGQVDLSGDWLAYLNSAVAGSLWEAERASGENVDFYREAAGILKAIKSECQA